MSYESYPSSECILLCWSRESATTATPALPIVDTISDDDSVLAGDAACATSVDTASVTTHRPVVWDIQVKAISTASRLYRLVIP
jgi:hypothetical protein